MKTLVNFFNKIKEKRQAKKIELYKRLAYNKFQAKEYKGEIWFTYDGNLVCPEWMLAREIVISLDDMRERYLHRNIDINTINDDNNIEL